MAASLSGVFNLQSFTDGGLPLASGRLYTFVQGTTTHKTAYTDAAGVVPQTYTSDGVGGQYIALDARGELPAPLYLAAGSYDLALKRSDGSSVWTRRADPTSDGAADVLTRLADADDAAKGDALIGVKLAATGATARTQHAKNADFRTVTDFGADPTGVADSTSAIQTAIDSYSSGNGTVYFPPGNYKVTGTITIDQHRVHLVGAGPYATQITFAPTAAGTCIKFERASVGVLYQCSIRGMALYSNDETYAKTAIESVTTSGFVLSEVVIGGSIVAVPGSGFWSDTTNASVGLKIRGHEAGSVHGLTAYCDKPIQISKNPNDGGSPGTVLDIDHWHFCDLYLGAVGPCITVDTGVNVTNVHFGGFQAWVLGTHGFYWADTTSTQSSNGLSFDNVRTEQGSSAAAFSFYIAHNYGLYALSFNRCRTDPTRKGFYLRKVIGVDLSRVLHDGTTLAIDADATVDKISGRGCYWAAGSTKTFAGQRPTWNGPMDPSSAALPPWFDYAQASVSTRTIRTSLAIFGSNDEQDAAPVSMADSTTQIVASNNATGRLFISTQEDTSAEFVLQGTAHTTVERDDPAGHFTNTANTPTSWNVYHDGSNYVIQNKRGSTWRVGWILIGSDTAI